MSDEAASGTDTGVPGIMNVGSAGSATRGKQAGAACVGPADCAARLDCLNGACAQPCEGEQDCPMLDGVHLACVAFPGSDGHPAEAKHCATGCDPVPGRAPGSAASACESSLTCTAVIDYSTPMPSLLGASCRKHGPAMDGARCTTHNDCGEGSLCDGTRCARQCGNDTACDGKPCQLIGTLGPDGPPVGFCSDGCDAVPVVAAKTLTSCLDGQVCRASGSAFTCRALQPERRGVGSRCDNADQCQPGMGCYAGECRFYCSDEADCWRLQPSAEGGCTQAVRPGTVVHPRERYCIRACDPSQPHAPRAPLVGCPVGRGCYIQGHEGSAIITDCDTEGSAEMGQACKEDTDCYLGGCNSAGVCDRVCAQDGECEFGPVAREVRCMLDHSAMLWNTGLVVGSCDPPATSMP